MRANVPEGRNRGRGRLRDRGLCPWGVDQSGVDIEHANWDDDEDGYLPFKSMNRGACWNMIAVIDVVFLETVRNACAPKSI